MIEQLLQIAAEEEPEKIAFIEEVFEKISSEYKEDFINEQQSILEECDSLFESAMEKSAAFPNMGKVLGTAKDLAGRAGKAAAPVLVPALGAMATSLLNDLYNSAKSSATKSKNYQKMILVNPQLENYDAHQVKAYFNTLHEKGGPEMSSDPFIAGSFVQNQIELGGTSLLDQVNKIVGTRKALSESTNVMKNRTSYGK